MDMAEIGAKKKSSWYCIQAMLEESNLGSQ